MNKGDLKILHKEVSKLSRFLGRHLKFLQNVMCFEYNNMQIMHAWRAMHVTDYLASRYQGHSLSVQCYEFYLHAILFL